MWGATTGAIGYKIEIRTTQDELVTESDKVVGTSWKPDRPLRRGVAYKWRVTAFLSGDKAATSELPARFYVLSNRESSQLAPIMKDHLEKGDAYRKAFLLDDAEREYGAIPPDFPSYGALAQTRLRHLK